jgi:hypothetical protein
MGREGARGPGELAEELGGDDLRPDALEPVRVDRELLADGRRCRGLAVRVREDRCRGMLAGELCEEVDDPVEAGQPDVEDGRLHGERVREVVDVLRGAGEVGQLGDGAQPELREAGPHVVLDGLHVVARRRLEDGELVDVFLAEVGHHGTEGEFLLVGEG